MSTLGSVFRGVYIKKVVSASKLCKSFLEVSKMVIACHLTFPLKSISITNSLPVLIAGISSACISAWLCVCRPNQDDYPPYTFLQVSDDGHSHSEDTSSTTQLPEALLQCSHKVSKSPLCVCQWSGCLYRGYILRGKCPEQVLFTILHSVCIWPDCGILF